MDGPELRETHISTLWFVGDRAFKLLKPVDVGFLDHRRRESRLDAVARELELNRRFCPDVYLGTADVCEGDEVVDRMLVMRRLPDDRALSAVIARGELEDDHLRSIARTVAAVHAGSEAVRQAAGPGSAPAVRKNWRDNLDEMSEFVGDVLDPRTADRVADLALGYLDGRTELFDRRVRDGFVRDGHGDLLAEDIFCLDDGPRILDCLAFRDDLRIGDVLADVAFLAMDLHRLTGPEQARRFLLHYAEFSGEVHPGSLAHHYVAYRAIVRCKVACLRWKQGSPEFAAVARMYHRMALDQLERARPRVVLVGGGPGTGKSSVAEALATHLGWPVLSSDEIRKDRARMEHGQHPVAAPDEGLYAPSVTADTYGELLRQARLVVATGHSAVLDASWTDADHRRQARAIAAELRAELVEIECTVDRSVARERVTRRLADGWNPSDATPEIVDHLAEHHDPWPEAVELDTAAPLEQTMEAVIALVDEPAREPGSPATPTMDFWGGYLAEPRASAAIRFFVAAHEQIGHSARS